VSGIDHDTLKPEADYKFFIYYDFYTKNNPDFHDKDLYAMEMEMTQQNRLYTPQLNHITLDFPSMALLPSRSKLKDSDFCNETSLMEQGIDCRKEFCKCHHVLQVPLGAVVEMIIVDEGFQYYGYAAKNTTKSVLVSNCLYLFFFSFFFVYDTENYTYLPEVLCL